MKDDKKKDKKSSKKKSEKDKKDKDGKEAEDKLQDYQLLRALDLIRALSIYDAK